MMLAGREWCLLAVAPVQRVVAVLTAVSLTGFDAISKSAAARSASLEDGVWRLRACVCFCAHACVGPCVCLCMVRCVCMRVSRVRGLSCTRASFARAPAHVLNVSDFFYRHGALSRTVDAPKGVGR